MARPRLRSALAALVLAGLALPAAAEPPIATGQLEVLGTRLTIWSDGDLTDADQVLDVGEPARVRTCFGGAADACGAVTPGDPRIAGLLVRAELSGPELPDPVSYETVPGGTFVLPGFQQEGDYRLANIRLVEAATGRLLGPAEPPLAVLHVRRILLTSATVTTLSLAELEARGITLAQDSFQAFSFAVGFAFGSETVVIDFPLLYTGNGEVSPLARPTVHLDDLPEEVARTVSRWQPPDIVPFRLEVPEDHWLETSEEPTGVISLPLLGAIVMPGNVTFLNQFFDARVIVANGAPGGSAVELRDLEGVLRLPQGQVLQLARTEPPVAPGQAVPVTAANGLGVLAPGEQGAAAWTLEGLAAGTHVLRADITGEIARPGRDPLPVASTVQAAVDVVDARFHLTFTHPDVVREGEAYSLFVTVANLSRATQNLITVEIRDQHLVGAHREDPDDTLERTINTLAPGQAETLEYRLVADLTGRVVAATFESSAPTGQGSIRLVTGVGELGIPLSPATLVMPRFADRLAPPHTSSDGFLRAWTRFLGLAYSLAVAPAGAAPELPRVVRADVVERAVDVAEAGQRTFLGDGLLESLEVLALDLLGARHDLTELDALRRATSRGLAAGVELAALIRTEQQARGLDAVALLDHLADTAGYAAPWLAAVIVPTTTSPAPLLEVRGAGDAAGTSLAHPGDHPDALRTLPFGEVLEIARLASGDGAVDLALVGRVEPDQTLRLILRNPGDDPADGRLVAVVPSPDGLRRVDFGPVTVPPHTTFAATVGTAIPDGDLALVVVGTGAPAPGAPSPWVDAVVLPPFRLIGAVQDFAMGQSARDGHGNLHRPNRHGNGVSYLFNRPPDRAAAETAARYVVRAAFSGQELDGTPFAAVHDIAAEGAWLQPSGRVVNVRYASPLSALLGDDGLPLVLHTHLLDTAALVDRSGESLDPLVPEPRVEADPRHFGGMVAGRVLRGTGEGVPGTKVELVRPRGSLSATGTDVTLDRVATAVTDADGAFFFDFVEEPHWDDAVLSGFTLRAYVPAGADPDLEPATVEEVGSIIRTQNRVARLNIALLGRGSVRGHLVWADSGAPVAGGTVTGASVLFSELKRTGCDPGDGAFALGGLPVGPITLTGRGPDGHRVYATVGIEQPGAVVDVELRIPRLPPPGEGSVTGTVLRRPPTGDFEPLAGARVAVYSGGRPVAERTTDSLGRFAVHDVPEGRVTVQAADWRVSRTPVLTDVMLAAGATVEVELVLSSSDPRAVTGSVLFHDPLTNTDLPVDGAVAFISGPGVFAYTGADGRYRIENVPVQGVDDRPYRVSVIDTVRQLQGEVALPPILDASPLEIAAQPVVLREMRGGVDGVVLDPLGRPMGGVGVVLRPFAETTSNADGTFSFDEVPLGAWDLHAHVGDGLQPGRVGFFGSGAATVVFGGHRPFATIHLKGAGVLEIVTRTAGSPGTSTPLYYRPTVFSDAEKRVAMRGAYLETATDQLGRLQLELPVGNVELVAANPFYGTRTVGTSITYPGQVRQVEIVFESARTVTGRVIDVDGATPVAGAQVSLRAGRLAPQTQVADGQGGFRFELVPEGSVEVTAFSDSGSVDRVGIATGRLYAPGQVLDLTVQMKAQGTISGCVVEDVAGQPSPIPAAQYHVKENSYPYRRLPEGSGWYVADGLGCYQVSQVTAGGVTVVARDPQHLDRQGSVGGRIAVDWEVVELPAVVISSAFGSVGVTVADPDTGQPVPDAQVKLSNGEARVTDAAGQTSFEALALDAYTVTAFHAPSGRSARAGFTLSQNGQHRELTLVLDRRGEVRGAVFDDPLKTLPVAGATVELDGWTSGGHLRALSTSGSGVDDLGRFSFLGIPEGDFDLTAAPLGSPRRAHAVASVTDTSPVAEVDLVLEAEDTVHFRILERLSGGDQPVDPTSGPFSVTLAQGSSYSFTRSQPDSVSGTWVFPSVLVDRPGTVAVQELGGEQRRGSDSYPSLSGSLSGRGSGTEADPYRVVLQPKGVVTVVVRDADSLPVAGASVRVAVGGSSFPSVTGADGSVSFFAVPAGSVTATATAPGGATGGSARGTLSYDDQVLGLAIALAPAVAAHGIVREPAPDDVYVPDPSVLPPKAGAIVQLTDSSGDLQVITTGADGAYRFTALSTGSCTVTAQDSAGQQLASLQTSLSGPNGFDNPLPDLVLDASPPRILAIVPAPGADEVSRTATVQITFSERLHPSVLPTGGPTSPYFALRDAQQALTPGSWSAAIDSDGHQIITFTPSQPYANRALYGLSIAGGPGGVRDRVGRPLVESGSVGSTFRTSDSVGPTVVGTSPTLARPVEPPGVVRVDFNEVVQPSDGALDGEAELEWGRDDGVGGVLWQPYPATLSSTRSGLSVLVQPDPGYTLTDDTLKRRLTVSGLEDTRGNPMQDPWTGSFRIWDANPPQIAGLPCPAGTVCTDLRPGAAYTVTPVLANLDDLAPESPGGDVDRVEYFLADPAGGAQPVASATQHPFAFTLVAVYQGNGTDPWPIDLWVRATDTSTNPSNVAHLALLVQPNQAPSIADVSAGAVSPVPGTLYAGSLARATATGVADPDGARLTLVAEMWRQGDPSPLAASGARTLDRPASGSWADLPSQSFDFTVPLAEAEGSTLFFRIRVTDSFGAASAVDSPTAVVADDQSPPLVESVTVRSAADGSARTVVHYAEQLFIEVRARDGETAVQSVAVDFDSIFAGPIPAARVPGSAQLYRTATLTVPVGDPDDPPTPVVATATATDWGGNDMTLQAAFEVAPDPDPTAPTVEWLTPWQGGPWPAAWTSTRNPDGTDLLARVRVVDTTLDGNGDPVPGEVATVEIRCPVLDGGVITLASTPVVAGLLAGSDDPGRGDYQVACRVPDGIPAGTPIPFEVRAVDTGGQSVVRTVSLTAVPWRRVFEAVPAASIAPTDPLLGSGGDPAGTVFLLDGSTVSLAPDPDGAPRALEGLAMYAGAVPAAGDTVTVRPSVLTAPEVTSISSSVLYYPLNLAIGNTFALGVACRVDMDGRGLHGNSGAERVALPGEHAADSHAGGSHGGSGWYGSYQGGWERTDLGFPGSVYDSVRDPMLPGSGGTGRDASIFGGHGGGVIRLIGPGATFHLAGELTADGLEGDDGYAYGGGGGAGGTVRLVAARLEGPGTVSADGGLGRDLMRGGAGGGGRVALTVAELVGFDPSTQASAIGGRTEAAGQIRFGGAGTVFVELADPETGQPLDRGALRLSNRSGSPAAHTPLPALGDAVLVDVDPVAAELTLDAPSWRGDLAGESLVLEPANGEPTLLWPIAGLELVAGAAPRQVRVTVDAPVAELDALAALLGSGVTVDAHGRTRLASLTATGRTRLATVDDLELQPAGQPAVVNDRAALALDAEARGILRGEAPVLTLTPTVPAGGDLRVGQRSWVTWSAGDPLGLRWTTGHWSLDAEPVDDVFLDEPLSSTTSGLPLQVPPNQPPGPVTFTASARDLAERVTTVELSWNVLPNAPPTAILSLADGAPPTVSAGGSTTVVVTAADAEGLATVGLAVAGPATQPSHSAGVSGTSVAVSFTVTARSDAAGDVPLTLQATVTDISGVAVTSATLEIPVTPDATPPVPALELVPAMPGDTYTAGDLVTLNASATDDVGVASLGLTLDGSSWAAAGPTLQATWTAPSVTATTVYTATVEASDARGNTASINRELIVVPNDNASAPTVTVRCPSEGAILPAGWDALAITADTADDQGVALVEFYLGTEVTPFATVTPSIGTPATFTATATAPPLPTGVGAGVAVQYRVRAYDAANNHRDAHTSITAVETVDLDPVEGYNDWASLASQTVVLRSGTLSLTAPRTVGGLILLPGAKVNHPNATPSVPRSAHLVVGGPVYIACGAAIDTTSRGYAENTTYPGASAAGRHSGGTHLGLGGKLTLQYSGSPGSVFGSVTRPSEAGGGGWELAGASEYGQPGGGVIRLDVAGSVLCDGAIRANGAGNGSEAAGAGGSIWIRAAGSVSGMGAVQATGGASQTGASGGGGAVAIEHGDLAGRDLPSMAVEGGTSGRAGGSGTLFLKGPDSTNGSLVVDNKGSNGATTQLPALGSGTAQPGSADVTLVTDRTSIPAYFVGHWVEVSLPDGMPKGTWQVEAISGSTLTLEAAATVAEGDLWQGVYRFDRVIIRGNGRLSSSDPIRATSASFEGGSTGDGAAVYSPLGVSGLLEVSGRVRARHLTAGSMTVHSGGHLSHPTSGANVESLAIALAGDLTIEAGGAIDVSGRGYGEAETYPGASPPGPYTGGSHLGYGNHTDWAAQYAGAYPGSTFGSVTHPAEAGGGGSRYSNNPGQRGGGILRIQIGGSATVDGAIRANGAGTHQAGAGGSVWLTAAGDVSGVGVIEARGGAGQQTSGGGGAIAVEHGGALTLPLGSLSAAGGEVHPLGGAGTIFVKGPASTFGDLVVDSKNLDGRGTRLPALGSGVAQAGSGGANPVTDRTSIPAYFVGHWVEVSLPDGTPKGTWQVEMISDSTLTLEAAATVAEGDLWAGVYRFDTLTVQGRAKLTIPELDEIGTITVAADSSLVRLNRSGPSLDPGAVTVSAHDGAYWVAGAAGAISDPDGIGSAEVVNLGTSVAVTFAVQADGSFQPVIVAGAPGDGLELRATDAHPNPKSASAGIGALPANPDLPVIDAGLVAFGAVGATYHVTGSPGAAADGDPPLTATATNITTGWSGSAAVAPDGSFDLALEASPGDLVSLTVTDGHPAAASTALDLGAVPDLVPPVIDPAAVALTVHDRSFWVAGAAGAVTDDGGLGAVEIVSPATPLTVVADGSFAEVSVAAPSGTVLTLRATDLAGNVSELTTGSLPANPGPPAIDLSNTQRTASSIYSIKGRGFCGAWRAEGAAATMSLGSCGGYPVASEDGAVLRIENRTTPGYGPWSPVLQVSADGLQFGWDSLQIAGAIGDAIWLVAEDDHPEWLAAEAQAWNLPQIPDAPAVNLGSQHLVLTGSEFHLVAPAGQVTGSPDPLTLTARLWHDDAGTWIHVGDVTTSIASGDPVNLTLPAGAVTGDLVVVEVTDSHTTPRTTAVRAGTLPAPPLPTVAFASATLTVDEAAGNSVLGVTLSSSQASPVSVGVATVDGSAVSGTDFEALATSVTFQPGETTASVEITVLDDLLTEGDETFTVRLSNPQGCTLAAPSTATVTVTDDDLQLPVLSMRFATSSDYENYTPLTLWVDLSEPAPAEVSATVAAAGITATLGSDFELPSTTVTILVGEQSAQIPVTLVDDGETEPDETFSIGLVNPSGATLGSPSETVVTIHDNDYLPVIDPGAVTLADTGCSFEVVGAAGAVTTPDGYEAEVWVTVDNPGTGADWQSARNFLFDGDPFTIALSTPEPGAIVELHAQHNASGLIAVETIRSYPNEPPSIDPSRLQLSWSGDAAYLSLPALAVTTQVGPVTATLHNLTTGDAAAVYGTLCPGDPERFGWIDAAASDEIGLVLCHGDAIQVCSDPPVSLGRAAFRQLDLGGAGVTGMWRSGRTVLVATTDGDARIVSLDDPWSPQVLPWHLPLPHGSPSGTAGHGPTAVAYADGSHLLLWRADSGIVSDVEPLGPGVPIDLLLSRGGDAIAVGRDASGLVAAVVSVDVGPFATLCPAGPATALPSTAGLTPLALLPLPHHRVGVLTDDAATPVRLFDLEGPSAVDPSTTVNLEGLPLPAQRAWLDDDWLVVEGADLLLHHYRMPVPGSSADGWTGVRGIPPATDPTEPAPGEVPATAVRCGYYQPVLGFDTGAVDLISWGETTRIDLPGAPVIALTETHHTLLAATPGGVYRIVWDDLQYEAELNTTQLRWEGTTLHVGAAAVSRGEWSLLRFHGEDASSDPVQLEIDLTAPAWTPFAIDLPQEIDGVEVSWYDWIDLDGDGSDFFDPMESQLPIHGPAFPDPDCQLVAPACGSNLVAAGAGWRAWAETGYDHVNYRFASGGDWVLWSIPADNVQHLTAWGSDRLAISGDVLTLVDLTDLSAPSTSTIDVHSGPEGRVLAMGDELVVASPGTLELAVVDVTDPANPSLVTAPTALLDGTGVVVDLRRTRDGDPFLVSRDPHRLIFLDWGVFPDIVVSGERSLAGLSAPPIAADEAEFDYPPAGGFADLLFVLSADGRVSFVDLYNPSGGILGAVDGPAGATSVVAYPDPAGVPRVLLAAGRGGGVTELWYAVGAEEWREVWLADLGDVRALALADPAFRAGETAPETCTDLSQATIMSTVNCSRARLFALTPYGPLAVPVDLCAPRN